jgi:hypothetical protein
MPFKAAKLPEAETAFFQQLDKIIQAATAENKEERLDYFADQITPTGTPAPSILADDGVTLRLVPGGMIALPANSRIAWSDKRERESFKS